MTEHTNYSLLPHNTFGIEAKAAFFITYDSVADLRSVLCRVRERHAGLPVLHIGGGSNLLFLSDFNGVVLHSHILGTEVCEDGDEVTIRVGAGMVWDDFVAYCVEHGYYGVENLSLIPGEVGAAAVQNIGAYGAEAKDVITCVEAVELETGESCVFPVAECRYGYRRSIFKGELARTLCRDLRHFQVLPFVLCPMWNTAVCARLFPLQASNRKRPRLPM